jgi:histidine decarboxylase
MNEQKQSFTKLGNLRNSIGSYEHFCDGYGNNHISGNGYVLGVVLSAAQVDKKLSHQGSLALDYINAFDKAEVADINIGKINLITVSSFCGPQGLILGYDLLTSKLFEDARIKTDKYEDKKIYTLEPLLASTRALLGTLDKRNYPIIAGAHVPCAGRHIEAVGPCQIYAALAMGITKEGPHREALLMEDAGTILDVTEDEIINRLIESIIEIGKNQKTDYETIFVGIKSLKVDEGKVGCALIQAPYLLLPQKPFSTPEEIIDMDLETWSRKYTK